MKTKFLRKHQNTIRNSLPVRFSVESLVRHRTDLRFCEKRCNDVLETLVKSVVKVLLSTTLFLKNSSVFSRALAHKTDTRRDVSGFLAAEDLF